MSAGLKRTLFQTLIYAFSIVFTKGVSVILTPLYSSTLKSAEEYGVYAYFLVAIAFLSILMSFGLETTYFRFENQKKYSHVANKLFSIHVLIALLACLIFIPFPERWSILVINETGYQSHFLVAVAILIADLLCVIPFAQIRQNNQALRYATINIIYVAVTLTLNLLALVYIPKWIENGSITAPWFDKDELIFYVLLATLAGSLVKLLLLSPEFLKLKLDFKHQLYKPILRYAIPITIAGFAYVINEMIDREFIKRFLDNHLEVNGIYSMNYKVVALLMMLMTAFRWGVEPFLFKLQGQSKDKTTYAFLLKLFTILMCLGALFIVFNKELIQTIYITNPAYHQGFEVVPPLLLAVLFLGIYTNLSIWYKLIDKTYFGMNFSIIGAIITLSINALFIKEYGYMACAWATCCCYFVMMLLSFVFGQKHYPIPYNIKRILTYIGLAFGLFALSQKLDTYPLYYHNMSLIFFIFVAYFLEKKDIKTLFNHD
ncbi:MAG: lipopolysaccharide biosynthesis protein [Flavobacteriales bacterium]